MSRYNALKHFLSQKTENSWTASFQEIENILNERLPKSAYQHPAWWANNASSSGRHCMSWLEAGWETSNLNLVAKNVTFLRNSKIDCAHILHTSKTETEVKTVVIPPWAEEHSSACVARCVWTAAGQLHLHEGQKYPLAFNVNVNDEAGLYKFHISHKNAQSVYIGESQNLKRRFQNYRSPGLTQKTSLRINDILIRALREQAEIAVYISTQAFLNNNAANFSQKHVRRLFENMEIVGNARQGIFKIHNL